MTVSFYYNDIVTVCADRTALFIWIYWRHRETESHDNGITYDTSTDVSCYTS